MKDMKIVQEMYARGFGFRARGSLQGAGSPVPGLRRENLMPSFSSIDGLGDKAADAVVVAARDGKFL